MRASQRKIAFVVVKTVFGITSRVTSQAGRIFIHITRYILMSIVGFGVEVTYRTTILGVIRSIGMTFGARRPYTLVFAAVNGEIVGVVLSKLRRHPVRVRCMASCAIIAKACIDVVGV